MSTLESSWNRLIRFQPQQGAARLETVLIGEPVDDTLDVGLAIIKNQPIMAHVYSGRSVLYAGDRNGETAQVGRLLSPLSAQEVGTIRCVGLNVSGWLGHGAGDKAGACQS
jgi:hypothetical protein